MRCVLIAFLFLVPFLMNVDTVDAANETIPFFMKPNFDIQNGHFLPWPQENTTDPSPCYRHIRLAWNCIDDEYARNSTGGFGPVHDGNNTQLFTLDEFAVVNGGDSLPTWRGYDWFRFSFPQIETEYTLDNFTIFMIMRTNSSIYTGSIAYQIWDGLSQICFQANDIDMSDGLDPSWKIFALFFEPISLSICADGVTTLHTVVEQNRATIKIAFFYYFVPGADPRNFDTEIHITQVGITGWLTRTVADDGPIIIPIDDGMPWLDEFIGFGMFCGIGVAIFVTFLYTFRRMKVHQ